MYLLDTNVVSEITKRRPNPTARAWVESTKEARQFISVLVLGEIRKGAEALARRDAERAAKYFDWLTEVRLEYLDRILPVSEGVAIEWGAMNAVRTLPAIDGLMAATAKVHDLTFVTRNAAPLLDLGVRLIDPFVPSE